MPPRSRPFVTAVNASLCGLVGLLLGGYGIDLVRLQRPDFRYGTMLAAAIVGGLGWCAGAAVTWFVASARPPASRADVVLFLLGALAVLWLGVQVARSVRYGNFGPMIDQEGSPNEPLLPVIGGAYRRRNRRRDNARRTRGLTVGRCRAPNRSVRGRGHVQSRRGPLPSRSADKVPYP